MEWSDGAEHIFVELTEMSIFPDTSCEYSQAKTDLDMCLFDCTKSSNEVCGDETDVTDMPSTPNISTESRTDLRDSERSGDSFVKILGTRPSHQQVKGKCPLIHRSSLCSQLTNCQPLISSSLR